MKPSNSPEAFETKVGFFETESRMLARTLRSNKLKGTMVVRPSANLSDDLPLSAKFNASACVNSLFSSSEQKLKTINAVEVFCGAGGLASGMRAAAANLGLRLNIQAAVDVSRTAELIYRRNIRPRKFYRENLETLCKYSFRHGDQDNLPDLSSASLFPAIAELRDTVDVFFGGPPCEGNSNFNNQSRRSDPRNELYISSTVIGILLDAKAIVFENVPQVSASKQKVVARARILLEENGYKVSEENLVLDASDFGGAQTRRRHFLIAIKSPLIERGLCIDDFSGLRQHQNSAGIVLRSLFAANQCPKFDTPSKLSAENHRRVQYLHTHNLYDLPDEERPACHRDKAHSYSAVYGRIHPERPVPTLTTGFLSPGRGRYTHPFEARGLTLREGAALQGFPSDYNWLTGSDAISRGGYATSIGDAVPGQLGFAIGAAIYPYLVA